MSYEFLTKDEQDEMYDLKVIINNLCPGILSIVSVRTLHFSECNDPHNVRWFVKRVHELRSKNDLLMKDDMLRDLEMMRDASVKSKRRDLKLGL